MAHYDRHRSHSHDYSKPRRQYDDDDEHRRVHFDDASVGCTPRRNSARSETREPNCSIQETTSRLKQSYENIEKGLHTLRHLQTSLHRSKQPIECSKCHSNHENKEYVHEIERLLSEIENLKQQLEKAGNQKRKYLEELSRLQNTLHRDRKKMEGIVRNSNTAAKKIKNKLEETSKKTREQQVLISKLKSDNATLWKTLQEIQDHLQKENTSDIESLGSIDLNEISPRNVPNAQVQSTLNEFSYDSTQDNFLSEKLKALISQSKRIQNMISSVNDCNSESQFMSYNKRYTDVRIPSENEQGVRSDMGDIMKRCEELERRVDECSTSDIRQRLLQQLSDIDSNSSTDYIAKDNRTNEKAYEVPSHVPKNPVWEADHHKRVREELLRCLDKIIHMEKNFKSAQDEIQRLRKYIQETAEEKEFSEKTYKREALELRLIVDDQNNEIQQLKSNVTDAVQELKDKEILLSRIEKLESLLDEKDIEISEIRSGNESDVILLKRTLHSKNVELETLKAEMKNAIDTMENLRRFGNTSTSQLQNQVDNLRCENTKLRESLKENIRDELSYLQAAIQDTENQMQNIFAENETLRKSMIEKDNIIKEIQNDNDDLINQLRCLENEINYLKSKNEMLDKEFGFNAIAKKDDQIKVLKNQVEELIVERNKARQESNEYRNEFEEKLQISVNDKEMIQSELENEIGKLKEDMEKAIDEKQIAFNALRSQDQEIKKLESKLKTVSAKFHENSNTGGEMEFYEINFKNKESYIELLKYKDQTIDSLRNNIDVLAREIEKYAMKASQNSDNSQNDIAKELSNIRQSMTTSHEELTNKIIELQSELRNLKIENKALKERHNVATSPMIDVDLLQEVERLKLENISLRKKGEGRYSGSIDEFLVESNKIEALKDENNLLRIALSKDRTELVDSNLRKRERIRKLEKELAEKSNDPPPYGIYNRRRSSSVGDMIELTKSRVLEKSRDEMIAEMKNQNQIILNLEEQNEKYRKELSSMKDELEHLRATTRINEQLQSELASLRKTFKTFSEDDSIQSRNKIKELETEINELKAIKSSPKTNRKLDTAKKEIPTSAYFNDLKNQITSLTEENKSLKTDLDVASNNLYRLAKIIDREQKLSPSLFDKNNIKRVENKVTKMDEENKKLKYSLNNAQNEIDTLNTELNNVRGDVIRIREENENLATECSVLKAKLCDQEMVNEDNRDMNELVDLLNNTIHTLEQQKKDLERDLESCQLEKEQLKSASSLSAKSDREDLVRNNNEMREKLNTIRKDNEDLDRKNKDLLKELENVRQEITETNFLEWFEKDVDKRVAMLSPDSYHNDPALDSGDRRQKRDATRIIRKLQIENQILRGKLLNMEEETVETIKLVTDMERGHGHLTGTLRSHLIIQKNTTLKILEGTLQQYATDFEILKKRFKSLEEKHEKEKKYSKGRDYAWDMFTNALATINNINTILNEGLIKVEEDLERDLSGDDFENKDYKSRLWILRRRLSDVENRHRELQLRAEELNLRLDAKQTEFEVTQDELEGTTRDLESRETTLYLLQKESEKISKENKHLHELIETLRENQHKTIGDVFKENESLRTETKALQDQHSKDMKALETSFDDMLDQLQEKEAALNIMRKMKDESSQEIIELKKKISAMEKRLKDTSEERDKLKKEAEQKAGYYGSCRDDHGTIHMLRDDIKRLAKENAELKQDITAKHRQIYNMSKDLHQLRMEKDLNQSDRSNKSRDEKTNKLINDIAELKAEKFLLETKIQEYERNENKIGEFKEKYFDTTVKNQLVAKEKEIEKIKRELTFIKDDNAAKLKNKSRDDTLSDLGVSVFDTSTNDLNPGVTNELKRRIIELQEENEVLHTVIHEKRLENSYDIENEKQKYKRNFEQQKLELEYLREETKEQHRKIQKLQSEKDRAVEKNYKIPSSLPQKSFSENENEIELWKTKAENLEAELKRLQSFSRMSTDDDHFKKLYLNKLTPDTGVTPHGSTPDTYLDMSTHHDSGDAVARSYSNIGATGGYHDNNEQKEGRRYKTQIPSRIPISPQKKKKTAKKVPSIDDSSKLHGSQLNINQLEQAKKLATQVEDIQHLLKSTNTYSPNQVKSISTFIDELTLLRDIIGLQYFETLSNLGENNLKETANNYIDNIKSENVDGTYYKENCMILTEENERMRHEYDTLQNTYNQLKNELTEIQFITESTTNQTLSSRSSVESTGKDSEIQALTEKYAISTDENLTLRELLETQTQNVKSQESVIKTLKKDIKSTKTKFNSEYDSIFHELKAKKQEMRALKKENKELKKVMAKEKEEFLALKKEEFSEKDYFISELQSEIEELNEAIEKHKEKENNIDNEMKNSLQEKIKEKESEYEEVLKYAESALEDAKKKLKTTNQENSELKIKIDELQNEKNREKEVFSEVKIEMKTALMKKNELIKSIQTEFQDYKKSKENEIKVLNKQIIELEKQCSDYKLLLEQSESTTTEITSHRSSIHTELTEAKIQIEHLQKEKDRLSKENETLTSSNTYTEKTSKTDTSVRTDATFVTDSVIPYDSTANQSTDLEIENEIIKGCNEELEERVEILTKQIGDYKKTLELKNEEHGNILQEHEQIKKDLEKSLEFLREIDRKNDELNEQNESLIEKNKALETQNNELFNDIKRISEQLGNEQVTEIQEQLLKSVAINEQDQIIIKDLETEKTNLQKENEILKAIEKDSNAKFDLTINKLNNDLNDEKIKAKTLENEILRLKNPTNFSDIDNTDSTNNNSNKEASYLRNQLALKENECYLYEQEKEKMKIKIKDQQENISKRTSQINKLEIQLEEWMSKANEKEKELAQLLSKKKQKQPGNELTKESTNDITINTRSNSELSDEMAMLRFDIANKNALIKTLQNDLETQHEQYNSVLNALNKRREESKLFLAMQDKLQNELERKEDVIKHLKFKAKVNNLDLSIDQSEGVDMDIENAPMTSFWAEDEDISNKESLIADQRQGLQLLSEQIFQLRERNQFLNIELEKIRDKYLQIEINYKEINIVNERNAKENDELKIKLKELRNFIQDSETVANYKEETKSLHVQTKLYTAYKEIREKNIEIASLNMNCELKSIEIENLKQHITKLNSQKLLRSTGNKSNITKCNHSKDVQSLVFEIHQQKDIEEKLYNENQILKENLLSKNQELNKVHIELKNLTDKIKTIEINLLEEDRYLKSRYVYGGSEENSEISEITSLSHPSTNPLSTFDDNKKNVSANDTILIDGFAENSSSESSVSRPAQHESIRVKLEQENSSLRKELQIKRNIEEKLKIQIKEIETKLKSSTEEIKTKDDKILLLEDRLHDLQTENHDGLKTYRNRLTQLKQENRTLKEQLDWQAKRFQIELDTLRVSLTKIKDEHVNSLKKDLEGTSKEKVVLQVRLKDIEENLSSKEKKINLLLQSNEELLNEVKKKNEILRKAAEPP